VTLIATKPIPGVAVACQCGGAICGESPLGPMLYRCATCRRLVPWCFGAADDRPDECDDCWAAAHQEAA